MARISRVRLASPRRRGWVVWPEPDGRISVRQSSAAVPPPIPCSTSILCLSQPRLRRSSWIAIRLDVGSGCDGWAWRAERESPGRPQDRAPDHMHVAAACVAGSPDLPAG